MALLLGFSAPAHATTLILDGQERPQPYQEWVDRARDGADACTDGAYRRPRRPSRGSGRSRAPATTVWLGNPFWHEYALIHELGHVYDRRVLEEHERQRFTALMHSTRPWQDQMEEVFADAYWSCSRTGRRPNVWTSLYRPPGRRGGVYQHRKICRLIHQASQGGE